MSDGHFRSLQPRNGQCLLQKSASKKSPHFEKKSSKNPPSYGLSPYELFDAVIFGLSGLRTALTKTIRDYPTGQINEEKLRIFMFKIIYCIHSPIQMNQNW